MRRRAPEPFAAILRDALADSEPATLLAQVQRVWPEVAGAMIAAHTAPAEEHAGAVTVHCEDAMFANELALMAPDLLDGLNARLTGFQVRELRFRVKTP